MKLSEVNVGDILAYSTKRDLERLWDIKKVEVIDTTPSKWDKGTVQVKFTNTRRNYDTNELEEYYENKRVALRFLVGDYTAKAHELALREKDKEISRLKAEAERRRRDDLLARFRPTFIEAGVIDSDYSLKFGGGWRGFEIALNEKQLTDLFYILRSDNHRVAEAKREQERLEAQRLAEATAEETVNA